MTKKNIITWDNVPDDLKTLVEIGLFTEEEIIEKLNNPVQHKPTSYHEEPVYATESDMTEKEAEFLFVHQGHWMNEWKLDMLLENGYEDEANGRWNEFIEDLLRQKEITKEQYDNWKDKFKC